jgi:hypothetical protein
MGKKQPGFPLINPQYLPVLTLTKKTVLQAVNPCSVLTWTMTRRTMLHRSMLHLSTLHRSMVRVSMGQGGRGEEYPYMLPIRW